MPPPDSRRTLRTFSPSFYNQRTLLEVSTTMCLSTHRHLSRYNHEQNKLVEHTLVGSVEYLFSSEQVGKAPGDRCQKAGTVRGHPIALVSGTPLGASLPPPVPSCSFPSCFAPGPQILQLLLVSTHFSAPEPPTGLGKSNACQPFLYPVSCAQSPQTE